MPKVLVSIPEADLVAIDAAARRAGESRSAFLVQAARVRARSGAHPLEDEGVARAYRAMQAGPAPASSVHRQGPRGSRAGPPLTHLVVDASLADKWLIPDSAEPDVPAARAILDAHMSGGARIAIPTCGLGSHPRARPGCSGRADPQARAWGYTTP